MAKRRARTSEALALRPIDVQRDSLVLVNFKNPSQKVFLPDGQADLPSALLLWEREHGLDDRAPPSFSRKRAANGGYRALTRQQAWRIVNAVSERVDVRVLPLRQSKDGAAGEPAPMHPHLFRHARVRPILQSTKRLPLRQRQAGWSRL